MPLRRCARSRGSLRRDEGGAASLAFVVLFPLLMYFFFALGEIGTIMTRQVMVERGLDMAVRDLRLAQTTPTHRQLKARICEAAFLLSGCEDALRLELTPLAHDTGPHFAAGSLRCADRWHPAGPAASSRGAPDEIIVVRACLVADPIIPGTGFAAMMQRDRSGAHAIVVTSAFVRRAG